MLKFSQKSIEGKVAKTISENSLILPKEKIAVAVSGGSDSICLLEILYRLQEKHDFNLLACHFNHKLRGLASDRDQGFVEKFCEKRGIELITGEAEAANLYKSEEIARDFRYSFFEKFLREGRADKIAIAHNQNDLAETFLLRLLRGSGLRGLQGMPLARPGFIRPLLYISRNEIEQFLEENRLASRLDATNLLTTYSRNRLRLETIPALMSHNPNLIGTLSANAKIMADDYIYLEREAQKGLAEIIEVENRDKIILNYEKWLLLPASLQRLTLRLAISRIDNLIDISNVQILEVEQLLKRKIGKKFKLLPHSLRISLEAGKIVLTLQNKEK
ncbi:MAG: tRNA lysidine(34) synthetase TilS [Candidatus Berkelbacteria bacterium]|nr:tRNA lysidine(34) synthetase TilS [Candidatus Berkelbacteria bacterium]